MEYIDISAKTLDEAITDACRQLSVTSDSLDYIVIEEGSTGFLGLGHKPYLIKARAKNTMDDGAKKFLDEIFAAMEMEVNVTVRMNDEDNSLDIELAGDDMGILIGKRGQTLDSLQYLTSIIVNKGKEEYIRVKIDSENYRRRRKDTLEKLAKNLSSKVKKTGRNVTLEPMNPYERRIIHSYLHDDDEINTYSVGDEPTRKVVISCKKQK